MTTTTATPPVYKLYSTDAVLFDTAKHLYLAFLREKGAAHRETKRYFAQMRQSAGHLIAAGA